MAEKIPEWWRPQDGDPMLDLLLKYLSHEDQVAIVTKVMQNDIAMKEQALDVQRMAVGMLKREGKVESK